MVKGEIYRKLRLLGDGICRLCWSDHDLAGDGTDGTSGCSIAEDCCDTVYAAGSSYSGIYTVYEKT